MVADCSADPGYRFGDLENLVRKARIDLSVEIVFLKPEKWVVETPDERVPVEWHASLASFGALADLASPRSGACLALARVDYPDNGKFGLMIVVKPNLCASLPVDLINFAADNPGFPQQTTADQFFDEAQWESYFQLGNTLGRVLRPRFIAHLQNAWGVYFENDQGFGQELGSQVADLAASPAKAPPGDDNGSRLPARLRAGAVTASIGLGAAATVGVSVWQGIEALLDDVADQRQVERLALKELTEKWAHLPGRYSCGALSQEAVVTLGELASTLVRFDDTLCASREFEWFAASPLARDIQGDVLLRCAELRSNAINRSPASCLALLEISDPDMPRHGRTCLVPPPSGPDVVYWGYHYARDALSGRHPDDPEAKRWRELSEERQSELNARSKATCMLETQASAVGAPLAKPGQQPAVVTTTKPTQAETVSKPGGATKEGPPVCAGRTVYIQIYGSELRKLVQSYGQAWQELGASVPPVEDVVATARARGRATPLPVAVPTLRYHDDGSRKCAEALKMENGWKAERLAPGLRASRDVIEFWMPPKSD